MNVFFHFYTQDGKQIGRVRSSILRGQHKKSHMVVWQRKVFLVTGYDSTTMGNGGLLTIHCKPTSANKVLFLDDDGTLLESPEANNGKV